MLKIINKRASGFVLQTLANFTNPASYTMDCVLSEYKDAAFWNLWVEIAYNDDHSPTNM